jgi:diguanylate cyclase (GGDEF)-like protein
MYAEWLTISAITNEAGEVTNYVGISSDITLLKLHEKQLEQIAHYDALTGIPNRTLLSDRMRQAIAQTARDKNMLAVCYLDLDGFKPINDTLGHEAGDSVLIEVANRIGATIRGGDTVARLGGDEFVVVLLGLEKGEECQVTLERILFSISEPIRIKDQFIAVSASIGVSIYPLDEEAPDILLRHADQAMYLAKQSGKNRFHIYDPTLDQRARNQHEFQQSIRQGLAQGQFELYYQPKINLHTKQLVGAEALIRWNHPERGMLLPGDFLRFIENTELDIEVGDWVIATALAQINQWGSTGSNIEISINISAYHLESSNFVEKLRQQLLIYPDIPRDRLQIEVLETAALNDIAIVREIIDACHKVGVRFALDDFGTGYCSLSYLSNLPVDVLKVDQSFVRDMLEDTGDRAIVQGIIALARAFKRQTVAEGIENNEHYRVLLEMDCELGQGYGIARPMPAHVLVTWMPSTFLSHSHS